MGAVHEQECPSCGAAMRFEPASGLLICDYCGKTMQIEPEQRSEFNGFDFATLSIHAYDASAEALPIYNCVSCGAEIIAASEQISLTCPYCRNNIVLTDKVSGSLRPDGVIPFRIAPDALPAALRSFYKGKVLMPKNFFSESSVGKVTGVYVPFWVFSGRLFGRLTFRGEKSGRSHRSGDYIITDTHLYDLERDVSVAFDGLPVDASGKIDDALMDSMEPFDLTDVKPFDPGYLAGFVADRFDVPKEDISARAEARMRNTADSFLNAHAAPGYASVKRSGGRLTAELNAKYLLFPVYLFDIVFRGETYNFAVNGQSGKVVGSVPTDKGVARKRFLVRAAAVLGIVLVIALIRYLLGR
ncbi:MAG: hypothetical protein K6F67_04885 [Oscillospiraceae bacterium]|nr:hypothetical protein [Oscillospiraceae bacterium]